MVFITRSLYLWNTFSSMYLITPGLLMVNKLGIYRFMGHGSLNKVM